MIKTSYRLIIIVVTAALLGIGMTGHDAPIESSARSLLFGFLPQPQVTLPVTALYEAPDAPVSRTDLLTAARNAAVKQLVWIGSLPSDSLSPEIENQPVLLIGLPATRSVTTGITPWHQSLQRIEIDGTKRSGVTNPIGEPSWWWPTPPAITSAAGVLFAPWQTPSQPHDPITFGFSVAGNQYASLSSLAALSLNGQLRANAPVTAVIDPVSVIAWNNTSAEWEGSVRDLLGEKIPPQHTRGRMLLIGEQGAVAATLARISALQDRWSRVELLPGGYSYQAIGLLAICALFLLWPLSAQWRLQAMASLLLLVILLNLQFMSLTTQRLWLPATMPALLILLLAAIRLWFAALWRLENRMRFQADDLRIRLASELVLQRKLDAAMHQLLGCSPRPEVWRSLYDLGREFETKRAWSSAKKIYLRISEHNPAFHDTRERLAKIDQTLLDATVISPQKKLGDTLITGDADQPAPSLGRYQLTREIGRGAMGVVYEGIDPHIGRKVAIKTLMLSDEFRGEALEEASARFYREAKAVGRLNHPHIVTVFDVGEEASLSYIAMDYVDGESLDFHTTKGKLLSMSEVLTICKHVADALDYAHSRNVIHRDIKPGNIIYNAQTKTVKVTDFGVASLTDDSRTRTGTVLGTPSYMSPEQINGQRVDGRADIFSLGVTLYELLTGTLPFQGDNLSALFNKILHQPPPSLRKTRADTPIALSRLVGRAMRKEPDKRFQTAGELVRALSRLQESIG